MSIINNSDLSLSEKEKFIKTLDITHGVLHSIIGNKDGSSISSIVKTVKSTWKKQEYPLVYGKSKKYDTLISISSFFIITSVVTWAFSKFSKYKESIKKKSGFLGPLVMGIFIAINFAPVVSKLISRLFLKFFLNEKEKQIVDSNYYYIGNFKVKNFIDKLVNPDWFEQQKRNSTFYKDFYI